MTCASCGVTNREGRKFCASCGAAMVVACPACGTANEPGDRFCGECGTPLDAGARPAAAPDLSSPAPPAARSAPANQAELKHVSVLFCDLVDFTTLSENRDAEDIRALLSVYFDAARRIVERYGGTVEKFIGDAVMAVWGTPVTREDDAQRAVRAALDLIEAIPVVGAGAGLGELRARAGVSTGQVASWASPGEGLVVGDRVNTAARIQSSAEPGSIFVDDVTRQATSAAIAYADRGIHTLKGKAEPLQLWQALRVVAYAGGEQRMDGLEAPLVGRAREMTMIKELFHGCVEEGRARLVAITGQAGIGKSRLHWELRKYVDGLAANSLWHSGRCLAYGDGVAYWALSEMVRQRFGIAEDDPQDIARDRMAAGLLRWIPDTSSHAFLSARLGVLLGTDNTGLPREELFAGWRMFFEQLAAQDPVVLVFEDMQWADVGLLDFVEQLLDWSAAHRIFIVSLARPDLSARRPEWMAGRRNVTPIYLDPMPDTAMAALLDSLVPALPAAVRAKIVARAEGMPLYAVETVRALVDRDVVVPRDGSYTLVGEIGDLDVPPTLTALIAARLDALEPEERTTVRGLSVLGSTFPRTAVDTVTDLDEPAIDGVLDRLVRKDVLTLTSDPLSPNRGQYRFVQALLRTVAYDTLSKRERKQHHLAVAEHLRLTYSDDGDDIAEVIAAHYRDALEAGQQDPDADDVRRQAVAMYTRAAARAASLGASESAEQAYLVARELTTDAEERTSLTESAAAMCTLSGHVERAVELYQEAVAAHQRAGRDHAAAVLAVPLAEALRWARRLDAALVVIRGALDELPTTDPARARALAVGSWVATFAGEIEQAEAWADDALLHAQEWDLVDVLTRAAGVKALAHSRVRPREAVMLLRWQLELLGEEGDPIQRSTAHHNLGELLLGTDQPGARPHFEAERAISTRIGDRVGEAIAVGSLMHLDIAAGAWDSAVALGESVLAERTEHMGDENIHMELAKVAAQRGDNKTARAHLAAMTAWSTGDDLQDMSLYDETAGVVALAADDLAVALARSSAAARRLLPVMGTKAPEFRSGWTTAVTAAVRAERLQEVSALLDLLRHQPPGYIPPYLRAQLDRFEALERVLRGESEDVEQGLQAAIARLHDLGHPYDRSCVEIDLAEWLIGAGRAVEAAPRLGAAEETLTSLGAAPQLRRIDALRRRASVPAR